MLGLEGQWFERVVSCENVFPKRLYTNTVDIIMDIEIGARVGKKKRAALTAESR